MDRRVTRRSPARDGRRVGLKGSQMGFVSLRSKVWVLALAAGAFVALAGCGSKPPPAAPALPQATAPSAITDATAGAAHPLAANGQTWTPEALEALLAPIALYPDPVLT